MRWLLIVIAAFAYYMLLAGSIGIEQAVSAVLLTAFTIAWSVLLARRGDDRRIGFPGGGLSAILRAYLRLPRDAALVGRLLVRSLLHPVSPARAVDRAFRFGDPDDRQEAGRRATAVIAGSLTPDTIVASLDRQDGKARCHRLLAGGDGGGAEWLA